MRNSGSKLETSLLLGPVILMFLFGFAVPIISFLWTSIAEIGSLSEIAATFVRTAGSRAAISAMITSNMIALVVTLCALLIAYPVAAYLCLAGRFRFTLVIFCIVVPYFTSMIVRTYSWMILLGRNGVVNNTLMSLGITDAPLALLYNRFGVIVGMTYILLPYMILTLFAAMKSVDPSFMRAARSLGAGRFYAFRRIYFPLTAHGVVSGSLIVFILAVGFFITPALMGGPQDTMTAMLIQRSVEIMFDWTSAAILSIQLLVVTLAIYFVYYWVTDSKKMMGA
ncbi:ABC transporter permease [Paracoccus sp. CPCC 101403]|uniref:ABC transporter permease n=1 Tax=Paracoccus broussonetiae TaxID=3075834 RepID=A0ABU3EK17_9RHOB|nr:ABC transporter permease [Paracoccus sp. CPCC 101403]MDT1064592.1 ABC transporter permease [Paracoccus sp. CPCC 101403]